MDGIKSYCRRVMNKISDLVEKTECPSCKNLALPTKIEGHIICALCRYEFCVLCMSHYPNSEHDPGMEFFCLQKSAAKLLGHSLAAALVFA